MAAKLLADSAGTGVGNVEALRTGRDGAFRRDAMPAPPGRRLGRIPAPGDAGGGGKKRKVRAGRGVPVTRSDA